MTDLELAALWLAIAGAGLAACVIVRALGLAATYVRDLLHVGAGIWILGWPYWHGAAIPIAIVAFAAIVTAVLPLLADRNRAAASIVHSVTNGDENWIGLVHYTTIYTVFTAIGLLVAPLPAAIALWSLSLGDGIGGAIGRAFGRHHYRAPGAKQKSFEGSAAVLLAAASGASIASFLFHIDIAIPALLGLGAVAAVTEALAPRGTDNLLIPIAVFTAAVFVT